MELAIIPIVDGQASEAATWLIKPEAPITWQATKVHGITNNDVADLQPLSAVEQDIRAHLGRDVLVAHNAHVEMDVLTRHLPGWAPAMVIDTLKLSRRMHPERPSHKLGVLVDAYALAADLPDTMSAHRADYDALVTARLLLRLAEDGGLTTLGALIGAAAVTQALVGPDVLFWRVDGRVGRGLGQPARAARRADPEAFLPLRCWLTARSRRSPGWPWPTSFAASADGCPGMAGTDQTAPWPVPDCRRRRGVGDLARRIPPAAASPRRPRAMMPHPMHRIIAVRRTDAEGGSWRARRWISRP